MRKADLQRLLKTAPSSPLSPIRFLAGEDTVYFITGVKFDEAAGGLVIQGEYERTIDRLSESDDES